MSIYYLIGKYRLVKLLIINYTGQDEVYAEYLKHKQEVFVSGLPKGSKNSWEQSRKNESRTYIEPN